MPENPFLRGLLIGVLTGLFALVLVLGLGARHIPSETPIGPLARIFDSLSLWLLGLSLMGAGIIWLLGARRIALVLWAGTAVAGAELAWSHRSLSVPLARDAEVTARVLFFNVRDTNAAFAQRIVAAALETDPDVMVFAEGKAIYPALADIPETYTLLTPCQLEACPFVIASRLPVARSWQLSLSPAWPDRYAVAELQDRKGRAFFVSAAHLSKPWFSGLAEAELARLQAQIDWLALPVLVVGDFNAAPWSRPISTLIRQTGVATPRWPVATWPASLGAWGVPIDLALVHNGARIVRLSPFGEGLNSNHRGLVIDLSVPG